MWVMTAVSTLASAILTGVLLFSSHKESMRQQLQATATSLVSLGITQFSELKDFEVLNRFVEDALQMDRIDKVIRVYDSSRRLIFTTAGADYDKLPNRLDGEIKKPVFLTVEGKQRRYESIVMPYEGEGSKKKYYLQVAIPLPKYSNVLENLWWQSLLLLGLLIGISVFLSQWLSRWLLSPVGLIAGHLQKMDPHKIEEWHPLILDERSVFLKAIAEGINLLADRTRAAIFQLRKMSRYVAHEMRTPLTILQGEAETALARNGSTVEDYRAVLKSSLEEIQRMSEIVSTVLQVGKDSRAAPLFNPVSINLFHWIHESAPSWEKTLERRIDFNLMSDEDVQIRTDPRLLYRLIDNLLRNVKNNTPPQSACCIEYAALGVGGKCLRVMDGGQGMTEAAILSLNSEKEGSHFAGIGLNLCFRIASICGLGFNFANRKEGGLKVEIYF